MAHELHIEKIRAWMASQRAAGRVVEVGAYFDAHGICRWCLGAGWLFGPMAREGWKCQKCEGTGRAQK